MRPSLSQTAAIAARGATAKVISDEPVPSRGIEPRCSRRPVYSRRATPVARTGSSGAIIAHDLSPSPNLVVAGVHPWPHPMHGRGQPRREGSWKGWIRTFIARFRAWCPAVRRPSRDPGCRSGERAVSRAAVAEETQSPSSVGLRRGVKESNPLLLGWSQVGHHSLLRVCGPEARIRFGA